MWDLELSVTNHVWKLYTQQSFPECFPRFKSTVRPWVGVMLEDMKADEGESDRRKDCDNGPCDRFNFQFPSLFLPYFPSLHSFNKHMYTRACTIGCVHSND